MFHKIFIGINTNPPFTTKKGIRICGRPKPNLQLLKILPVLCSQYSCQFQSCQTKLISVLQR